MKSRRDGQKLASPSGRNVMSTGSMNASDTTKDIAMSHESMAANMVGICVALFTFILWIAFLAFSYLERKKTRTG